jgi:aldehyde:ferredoxin oxidoreductase
VACIGPAGEALVYGASVRAESAYGASQGGAGAAWGAKHLKAIAVAGSRQVPMADAEGLGRVAERWLQALREQPLKPIEAMHADGLRIMPGLAERGFVPRHVEKLRSGPAARIGLTIEELITIRDQSYACLGWSTATGAPARSVLERLGLHDFKIGRA